MTDDDQAKRDVHKSKTLLHVFIDEADIPIAIFDREMRYLAASQCWIERLCGGNRGVIGQSHYEVVPEVPQHWRDMHQRVLAGETVRDESDRFQGPDGRTLWVRRELRPWHDLNGEVGGVIISAEDLTQVVETQQALRESNAKSAAEAKALAGFYHASLKSWQAVSVREGLDEMLLGILDLFDTDMGSIQLLDADGKILRMVAHRGFERDFLEFSREISADQDTACGRALRGGNIVVVEDVDLEETDAALRSVRRAARYRAVVSAPLINSRRTPLGMISVHFHSTYRPSASEMQWLELYRRGTADFIDRFRSQEAVRESEERLRLALATGQIGLWEWNARSGTYFWSDENYRLFGYQVGEVEPNRATWALRVHPEDLEAAESTAVSAQRERREYIHEYRVIHPGGSLRWIRARGRFIYQGDEPVRVIGLSEDITETRQQFETQRVLVAELQHRTRNLMAVVQSVAHQTLDSVNSLADFKDRFDSRLQALSRVQSLLSRADNEPITLEALLVMELEALGFHALHDDRITFRGPEVPLHKSVVEMLSLAIHELLTNAIKYGALANPTGGLSVNWRVEGSLENQRLVFEWIERGIIPPLSTDPIRSGYGRALIEEALPYSLSAETKLDIGRDILRCWISLPLTANATT